MLLPKKFIEFLKQIIANGDWEYGDGTSMTKDVEIILAEYQNIKQSKTGLQNAYPFDNDCSLW